MNTTGDPLQAPEEMTRMYDGKAFDPYLSPAFKVWIVSVIFFLIFLHLINIYIFPLVRVIPENVLLGVALAFVGYLWVQELREKYRLQDMNSALILAQQRLIEAEVNTIATLNAMIEAKDPYVHGHSSRVAELASSIAKTLEFAEDTCEVIRRAAQLHDIGKLVIPESILHKPGPLSEEEWQVVRLHPETAARILKTLKFLHLEKNIILNHHERPDGKGYPKGLKGKDIPYEARILAVANTFDTMNTPRPYRQHLSREDIVRELKEVSGSQLDPTVVTVFLRLLEKNPDYWGHRDR